MRCLQNAMEFSLQENNVLQRHCPVNAKGVKTFEGDITTTGKPLHPFWKLYKRSCRGLTFIHS